jgi:hypothetical protein
MIRVALAILTFSLFTASSWATVEEITLPEAETLLHEHMMNMRGEMPDAERNEINLEFKKLLYRTLSIKGAFKYKFESLPLCKLKAPDDAFRIFNWNVANNDFTHQYYCYVLKYSKRERKYVVTELKDRRGEISKVQERVLFQTHWVGALYYDIIALKRNGRKLYTLIGWDGNDKYSQKKVIEVLSFSGRDMIKLGAPIFKTEKGKTLKRIVFEYSTEINMSLRWDKKNETLIFDHLAPQLGTLEGHLETYGPDLSFDCFTLTRGRWNFVANIQPTNRPNRKQQRQHVMPQDQPNIGRPTE